MRKILIGAVAALAIGASAPAKAANIVETAQQAGQFKTLIAAAQAAGLAGALAEGDNLTVFAPTDAAFDKLPEGTVKDLLKPDNKDKLAAILSYHVLPRELASNMLPGRRIHVSTLKEGGDDLLAVDKDAHTQGVTVDGANVVQADIQADNGLIHVIDEVLIPSD